MHPTPYNVSDAQSLMAFQTHKKELAVAFLLWWFLGIFGGHRFYLGRAASGIAMLSITVVSIPLALIFIGVLTLGAVWIWWLVDAFLLSGWVTQHNMWVMSAIAAQTNHAPHPYPALPESMDSQTGTGSRAGLHSRDY